MAGKTTTTTRKKKSTPAPPPKPALGRRLLRWTGRFFMGLAAFYLALILIFAFVPPPINIYQMQEAARLGGISKDWVAMDDIAPVMARSVVAAEDANFCNHWGFDMVAIRAAIAEGSGRGASTLSQQTVKNVFLWQGRNWLRKAMEAGLTPFAELVWTKRRMLTLYLNVAEFGEGVFGVQAAAQHYFGVDALDLTPVQAARLAAALPNPKERNPANPTGQMRRRAGQILDGAETIRVDGRAACFE
jgi:monofunctional biosynthetic peptidoglycan transglycosylase